MKIDAIDTTNATIAPAAPATVETAALVAALSDVVLFIERKTSYPMLAAAVFRFGPAGLTIEGTNLDQFARAAVPCATDGGTWSIGLDPRAVLDAIKKSAAPDVEFRPGAGHVELIAGRIALRLPTVDMTDFPILAADPANAAAVFPAAAFAADLARVSPAISTEETRYYLNGIFMHAHEGALRMAATDGHRLHIVERPMPDAWAAMPSIIAPRTLLTPLAKIMAAKHHKADARISVAIGESQVVICFGGLLIVSKTIDGRFPDYQRVIPTKFEHGFTVETKALVGAVDAIKPALEKGSGIGFALSRGQCVIAGSSPDKGSANAPLAVEFGGPDYSVGFNHKYVLDIAKAFGAASLRVQGFDASSPHLMTSADAPGFFVVLMPMRMDAIVWPQAPAAAAPVEPVETVETVETAETVEAPREDAPAPVEPVASDPAPAAPCETVETQPRGSFAAYVEREREIVAAARIADVAASPTEAQEAPAADEAPAAEPIDEPATVPAAQAPELATAAAQLARIEALASELASEIAALRVELDDAAAIRAERDALQAEVARLRGNRARVLRGAAKTRARGRSAAQACEAMRAAEVKAAETPRPDPARAAPRAIAANWGLSSRLAGPPPALAQHANVNAMPARLKPAA